MLQELNQLRGLLRPATPSAACHQTSGISEKLIDMLQFKISAKKEMSEMAFKVEREQSINVRLVEENEEL